MKFNSVISLRRDNAGEDYETFDKYEVGQKLGLSDSETDNIVDDLYHNHLIKK